VDVADGRDEAVQRAEPEEIGVTGQAEEGGPERRRREPDGDERTHEQQVGGERRVEAVGDALLLLEHHGRLEPDVADDLEDREVDQHGRHDAELLRREQPREDQRRDEGGQAPGDERRRRPDDATPRARSPRRAHRCRA
jgi:hypothetical protein